MNPPWKFDTEFLDFFRICSPTPVRHARSKDPDPRASSQNQSARSPPVTAFYPFFLPSGGPTGMAKQRKSSTKTRSTLSLPIPSPMLLNSLCFPLKLRVLCDLCVHQNSRHAPPFRHPQIPTRLFKTPAPPGNTERTLRTSRFPQGHISHQLPHSTRPRNRGAVAQQKAVSPIKHALEMPISVIGPLRYPDTSPAVLRTGTPAAHSHSLHRQAGFPRFDFIRIVDFRFAMLRLSWNQFGRFSGPTNADLGLPGTLRCSRMHQGSVTAHSLSVFPVDQIRRLPLGSSAGVADTLITVVRSGECRR